MWKKLCGSWFSLTPIPFTTTNYTTNSASISDVFLLIVWLEEVPQEGRWPVCWDAVPLLHCLLTPTPHPPPAAHSPALLFHSTETPESHWHKGWGSCTESVNFLWALLLSTAHSPPASDLEWFSSLQRIQPISPRTPPGHHRDTNWSLQGKSAYQLGSSSLVDLNALYQRQLQESISSVKHFHLNPSEHYSHLIKTKLSMLWPWPAPRN